MWRGGAAPCASRISITEKRPPVCSPPTSTFAAPAIGGVLVALVVVFSIAPPVSSLGSAGRRPSRAGGDPHARGARPLPPRVYLHPASAPGTLTAVLQLPSQSR